MLRRCGKGFHSNYAFEHGGGLGVFCGCWNNTGTIYEVYPFCEGDVLPDLTRSKDTFADKSRPVRKETKGRDERK